jgi:hypothetical protein
MRGVHATRSFFFARGLSKRSKTESLSSPAIPGESLHVVFALEPQSSLIQHPSIVFASIHYKNKIFNNASLQRFFERTVTILTLQRF